MQERCIPGIERCYEGQRQNCSAQGTWRETPCLQAEEGRVGQYCFETAERVECRDQVCIPNRLNCSVGDDQDAIIQCNELGSNSATLSLCPQGSRCTVDENSETPFCLAQICTPNTLYCDGDKRMQCNESGSAVNEVPCPSAEFCTQVEGEITCILACGNRVVNGALGEECDDGNQNDQDRCTNECQIARCGDGLVYEGVEECDRGELNSDLIPDRCRLDCSAARCGDGVIDTGEECDDGNLIPTDGCNGQCILGRCGDGVVDLGEECDDANDDANDFCTNACTIAQCGDGYIFPLLEDCDDGNQNDQDECLSNCKLPRCGDQIVREGIEECDDGNQDESDGCSSSCILSYCGDGILNLDEECDDGNLIPNDECNNQCLIPTGQLRCINEEGESVAVEGVDPSDSFYKIELFGNDVVVVKSNKDILISNQNSTIIIEGPFDVSSIRIPAMTDNVYENSLLCGYKLGEGYMCYSIDHRGDLLEYRTNLNDPNILLCTQRHNIIYTSQTDSLIRCQNLGNNGNNMNYCEQNNYPLLNNSYFDCIGDGWSSLWFTNGQYCVNAEHEELSFAECGIQKFKDNGLDNSFILDSNGQFFVFDLYNCTRENSCNFELTDENILEAFLTPTSDAYCTLSHNPLEIRCSEYYWGGGSDTTRYLNLLQNQNLDLERVFNFSFNRNLCWLEMNNHTNQSND